MPTVRAIVKQAAKDNYRFSAILNGIVTSDAFQMNRKPEGAATAAALAVPKQQDPSRN
jgi:Protein of unknown function (DUF1585)